jgi:hypothetical protein
MSALDQLTYEDLQLPYNRYQTDSEGVTGLDQPVIGWVAGDTYDHYEEHIQWIKSLVEQPT